MKDLRLEKILRRWAQDMVNRYTWLTIRFEYSEKRRVFLVSYSPRQMISGNEPFIRDSMEFEDRMNDIYSDDAPLFCDEERLFRLSPAAEVIRYEPKRMLAPSPKKDNDKNDEDKGEKAPTIGGGGVRIGAKRGSCSMINRDENESHEQS